MLKNIISFDLEEWGDPSVLGVDIGLREIRSDLAHEVNTILELLAARDIKATFFVVGKLAQKYARLLRLIDQQGHEIASHGYAHVPISTQNPEQFREDLQLSIKILQDVVDKKIIGYRAPGYSITKDTWWALQVIKECGLRYDSSIYPVSIRFFTQGGISDCSDEPFYVEDQLIEFPLATFKIMGIRVPIATTAYFRILPYCLSRWALKKLNRLNKRATLNFHTWEFGKNQPKLKLPFPHNIKTYYNLSKMEERFKKLLNDFEFMSCAEAVVKDSIEHDFSS